MFEKEKFKNCLLKARGNRTNESFSKESGVSRAYISAYLNLKRDEPPTPDILRRLALASRNSVIYEDLMMAAGFIKDINYSHSSENSLNTEEIDEKYKNDKIKAITNDIANLSPESKKELEKYIQLLKLKDSMEKTKDEMSSPLVPNVSQSK